MSKAIGATQINDLEAEIGKSLHQLKRTGTASPHQENVATRNSGDDLGILFRRMTERSTLRSKFSLMNSTASARS